MGQKGREGVGVVVTVKTAKQYTSEKTPRVVVGDKSRQNQCVGSGLTVCVVGVESVCRSGLRVCVGRG
eukprot:9492771-Pyramimonas_sp.AAC.1